MSSLEKFRSMFYEGPNKWIPVNGRVELSSFLLHFIKSIEVGYEDYCIGAYNSYSISGIDMMDIRWSAYKYHSVYNVNGRVTKDVLLPIVEICTCEISVLLSSYRNYQLDKLLCDEL